MSLCYRIGTDEAGYGPTLGPLIVSATLWSKAESSSDSIKEDTTVAEQTLSLRKSQTRTKNTQGWLFDEFAVGSDSAMDTKDTESVETFLATLSTVFATELPKRHEVMRRLIAVDSKKIYTPARGMATLESQLRGFLTLVGVSVPIQFWQLLQRLCPTDLVAAQDVPWYRDIDPELLVGGDSPDERVTTTRTELESAGIALRNIRSRFLDAAQFNAMLAHSESKASLLADLTLGLIVLFLAQIQAETRVMSQKDRTILPKNGENLSKKRDCSAKTRTEPIEVVAFCDKLGGRNAYAPTLMSIFRGEPAIQAGLEPFGMARPLYEGRAESAYVLTNSTFRLKIYFTAKGEKRVPVAMASMVSKFLRETAMAQFNRFWRAAAEGWMEYHPTAGYPEDAVRFLAEMEPIRKRLGIPLEILRRNK